MNKQVLILNGPNLNLLGTRQKDIYGEVTLADIDNSCQELGAKLGLQVTMQQSNYEGQLVDWIHEARESAACIIINAGAYTHTSIALLDALNTFVGLVFEVHISNIYQREDFRHKSYVTLRADGVLAGFGVEGYELALRRASSLLNG